MSDERRAFERLPLSAEIDFRRVSETAQTITLQDLSRGGCKVEVSTNLAEGDRVWVHLPGLESLPSVVRWSSGWQAGASFDHSIHPAVFDAVKNRIQ